MLKLRLPSMLKLSEVEMLELCGDAGINPTLSGFIPCLKHETHNCVALSCGAFSLSLHSGKLEERISLQNLHRGKNYS